MILDSLTRVLSANALITAFVFVGLLVWFSYWISKTLTRGHVHGSAIAIALGLVCAWVGGLATGGSRGLADIPILVGVGTMGGAMFRDFAIVATAFGADLNTLKKAGAVGAMSIVIGVLLSFAVGAVVAVAFGYTDPVTVTFRWWVEIRSSSKGAIFVFTLNDPSPRTIKFSVISTNQPPSRRFPPRSKK